LIGEEVVEEIWKRILPSLAVLGKP